MTAAALPLPTSPADPLVVQVRRTAEARAGHAILKAELDRARAAFEQSYETLIARVIQVGGVVAAEEAALRELTLRRFEETGDKHPAPGVGIRLETVVDIPNPAAALEWAKTSGLALMVDLKALKQIAAATAIPCATVRQEPKATIATDLAAALGLPAGEAA